ncbi:INACTIVE PURPLE ACID PHOSPHATASE 9-RELATED [Salix purpurea]|uniref:Purple acid phosphatase n=1 Tax=Salix purpurea TaxID=77065 RepID=A0A9Q0TV98_SALPP|nr:INACTIVE PURPLE ACID PHOSPHATASE 9-RELATED [Salix purpurea]
MMKLPLFLLLISLVTQTSLSEVTISVTPTILQKSGDIVTISWSNVDSPSKLDWLGLYSPPDSPHDHFIGYKFLSSSPSWKSGSGSISLPITNLRSNYSFRIFHWTESEINPKLHDHDHNPLPGTAHLLAESDVVVFEPGHGPEQIHLAYTDVEDEMRVMFVVGDGEERSVKWGERDGEWSRVSVARVVRYEREDMCDAPANGSIGWRDPGWIHDGVMKDLKKGVRYYYQVGSDSKGWSTTQSFVSRNGDSDETIAFLFGDMGTSTPYATFIRTQDESIATMKWILRDIEAIGDKHAFISHIGDISYARGYSWLWDHFFTQVEPVASKVPYHVCIGNHEYDWPLQPWKPDWAYAVYGTDGGGECGGAVHFVYISTETNFVSGSSQYNFIKQDLESVNRSKTPFVVVQGHRPMYTSSNENRDAPMRNKMLEHLEPLFTKNNVTLALWGHGQDWQPIWEPRADHPNDPIFPQPAMSMYRGGEFGYTKLVATKEKLTLTYVGNHDGQIHDMVEILASGEVLSGDDSFGVDGGARTGVVDSTFSWYVKGGKRSCPWGFCGLYSWLRFLFHEEKW